MDRSHYLHVHIPGRGRLTLSLPDGVARALRDGRLPDDTEAWYPDLKVWVLLTLHPVVRELLAGDRQPERASPGSLDLFQSLDDPASVSAVDSQILDGTQAEPEPSKVLEPDPAQLPLIPLEDWVYQQDEFSRFLARSIEQEQRRDSVRNSGGARPSGALRVFVAGIDATGTPAQAEKPLGGRLRLSSLRLVAAVVLLLVGGSAAGILWYVRVGGSAAGPRPNLTVTNALSAGRPNPEDSAAFPALSPDGSAPVINPLAESETDLENNLRIAEAAVWQPALDFASADQIVRSIRKVDAVRNSLSLYRVASWQLIDSLHRDSDPRQEPFTEATRIDDVLNVMQSAVVLLDSLLDNYHVRGDLLVFDRAQDAERYNALCRKADSLIRAPVDLDSSRSIRAPRRVVMRLLGTLPPGVTQYRKQE
jgi:hypothetical protein